MSIFRALTASAILATTIPATASAHAGAPVPNHTTPSRAAAQAETAKRAVCEKVWAAQKVRHGSRLAFVAACVAKG